MSGFLGGGVLMRAREGVRFGCCEYVRSWSDSCDALFFLLADG